MKRVLVRASVVLAFAAATMGFVAAPGGAATAAQSCAHLSGTATFSPGLTNTPTNNTVTAKGTQTSCTPLATTGGSGALSATLKVTAGSCAKLATGKQTLTATATTTWKNKKVSKYALTFVTGSGSTATVATITGKVTSGLFVGHKVSGQIKFTVTGSPNCTSKPVKTATFTNTKPFVIV